MHRVWPNRCAAPRGKGGDEMSRRALGFAAAASLFWLSLFAFGFASASALGADASQQALDAACKDSPVLFSYSGSVYASSQGEQAQVIASGRTAPREITWAPGCKHYALIDPDALWVGTQGGQLKRVVILATVRWRYQWSPDGESLAVEGDRRACEGEKQSLIRSEHSDIFLVNVKDRSVEQLTQNCRTYLLGWSDDSKQLLFATEVLQELPCDPTQPPCAASDLRIWDRNSHSARTLITAEALDRQGLGEFALVTNWEADKHVIYCPYYLSQTGMTNVFAAIDDRTGKILWSHPSMGNSEAYLGEGLFRIDVRVYDPVELGYGLEPVFLDRNGRELGAREAAAKLVSLGGGSAYEVTLEDQASSPRSSITFLSRASGEKWQFALPQSFGIADSVWSPSGTLVVEAYEGELKPRHLTLAVWVVDPQHKSAKKVFEATSNNVGFDLQLTPGGSVLTPRGIMPAFSPLVLARWSR